MKIRCFRCKTQIEVEKGHKVTCPKCNLLIRYSIPKTDKTAVKNGKGIPSPTAKKEK